MRGRIKFSHRALLDVVIAEVDCTLDTDEDVRQWYEEYRSFFATRFSGRKVDLILELSKFHVNPKLAASFGEHRARILSEFTRRSYRVKQSLRERTLMYTSSAIHGAPANDYASIDDAVAAMLVDRQLDTKSPP